MCQAVLIDRGLDLLLFVPHLALPLFGFLGASKAQILSDLFSVAFLFFGVLNYRMLYCFLALCVILYFQDKEMKK